MEIIKGIEQGSPVWFQLKINSIGGSYITSILAKPKDKKAKYSASWNTLKYRMAGEILTGIPYEGFKNSDMERGNFYESEARTHYEFIRDVDVETVSLIKSDTPGIHFSPDGLVGEDGGIEIKTQLPHVYIETKDTEKIDIGYIRQCQHFLFVSGRKWIDFCAYCPELKDMWIRRFERDEEMIAEIESKTKVFLAELNELVNKIRLG